MTREEQLESVRNTYDVLKYHSDYDHWYRRGNIRDWFRFVWHRPKRIFQRAKLGYCNWDLWDCGEYFMYVLASSMRQFAENTIGVPTEYCDRFDDDFDAAHEAWKNDLLDMARKIENILVEYHVGGWTPEKRAEHNKEVFDWLAEHWDQIWE